MCRSSILVDAGLLYARRTGLHEAQNEVAEVRLRLERYIGSELKETPKNPGGRPEKTGNTMLPVSETPTYKELGVGKMQASRFQQEASVPDEVFEQHLAETKDKGQEVTTAGVLKLANKLVREERLASEAKEKTQEKAAAHRLQRRHQFRKQRPRQRQALA